MNDIQNAAQEILNYVDSCVGHYAEKRKLDCVGQFLDQEGCENNQCGIYGMSGWLMLASHNTSAAKVVQLTNACKQYLINLTNQINVADNDGSHLSELKSRPESNLYELRFIVPKMIYAYEGLSRFNDCKAYSAQLQGYIIEAQRSDGSWGFFLDSANGSLFVTSFAVRAFWRDPSFQRNLLLGLRYLEQNYKNTSNLYERLFVLNTIQMLDKRSDLSVTRDHRAEIKNTIQQLIKSVYSNPTKSANPLNIDFNDEQRTRFIRIPTDLILLESCFLLSGHRFLYLRSHIGRQVFKNVTECLQGPFFSRDTSGHRAAIGTFVYIAEVMKSIVSARGANCRRWLWWPIAWLCCSTAFGINFSFHALVFSLVCVCTGAAAILWRAGWLDVKVVILLIGVLVKYAIDIAKVVYDLQKYRGES